MSVRDASRQQGAAVTQFPCSDNYYDQYWEIVDSINPPGYKLVVDFNSQQVLSVLNASLALGAPVDQWDYSPNYLDQLWYLPGFYNSDGLGALVNYHSNACLSVPNASQQQDVQLDQWNCDVPTFTDQTWKIIYVRNMAPLPV